MLFLPLGLIAAAAASLTALASASSSSSPMVVDSRVAPISSSEGFSTSSSSASKEGGGGVIASGALSFQIGGGRSYHHHHNHHNPHNSHHIHNRNLHLHQSLEHSQNQNQHHIVAASSGAARDDDFNDDLEENVPRLVMPRHGADSKATAGNRHFTNNLFPEGLKWRHPLLCAAMFCACILTVAGNCLVVLAVCTKKYLRNPTGYLIVSLAVADLIVGMVVMPLNSLFEMTQHVWLFGLVTCDVFHALDILASTSSIWNLCVISLDRWTASHDPIGYRDRVSKRRILLAIAFVWIISACISFPAIFWWRYESPELYMDNTKCQFTDSRVYIVFSSLVSFYIPLVLILFAYGRVFMIATRHTQSLMRGEKQLDYSTTASCRSRTGSPRSPLLGGLIERIQSGRRFSRSPRRPSSAMKNGGLCRRASTRQTLLGAPGSQPATSQVAAQLAATGGDTLRIHFGRKKSNASMAATTMAATGAAGGSSPMPPSSPVAGLRYRTMTAPPGQNGDSGTPPVDVGGDAAAIANHHQHNNRNQPHQKAAPMMSRGSSNSSFRALSASGQRRPTTGTTGSGGGGHTTGWDTPPITITAHSPTLERHRHHSHDNRKKKGSRTSTIGSPVEERQCQRKSVSSSNNEDDGGSSRSPTPFTAERILNKMSDGGLQQQQHSSPPHSADEAPKDHLPFVDADGDEADETCPLVPQKPQRSPLQPIAAASVREAEKQNKQPLASTGSVPPPATAGAVVVARRALCFKNSTSTTALLSNNFVGMATGGGGEGVSTNNERGSLKTSATLGKLSTASATSRLLQYHDSTPTHHRNSRGNHFQHKESNHSHQSAGGNQKLSVASAMSNASFRRTSIPIVISSHCGGGGSMNGEGIRGSAHSARPKFSAFSSGMREKSRKMFSYMHEQRAARTLSIVVGVFILCWLPFFIFAPIMVLCKNCVPNAEAVFSVITWAGHLNSMMNPLIYSRFSREFRKAFKQILTCEGDRSTKTMMKSPLNVMLAQLTALTQLQQQQQQQQQAAAAAGVLGGGGGTLSTAPTGAMHISVSHSKRLSLVA